MMMGSLMIFRMTQDIIFKKKKNIKSEIPNDDYFIISHLKLSCLGLVLFVEAILSKTVDVQQNDL